MLRPQKQTVARKYYVADFLAYVAFSFIFLVISAFLLLILHSSSLKTKWFSITYYFYLDLFPYMEYLDVSS